MCGVGRLVILGLVGCGRGGIQECMVCLGWCVGLRCDVDAEDFERYVRLRLRRAREVRNLSQADLAVLLGVSRVAVCDMERGRVRLTVGRLCVCACVLKSSLSEFLPEMEVV